METKKGLKFSGRKMIGKLVSTKMKNTVTVEIERRVRHPLYKKSLRRTKKYLAHTDIDNLKTGDYVVISEARPISKRVHFRLIQVIDKK